MNWFQFFSFFRYLVKARYYKGHGVHSPFMFYLVREIFFEKHPFYVFKKIKAIRSGLLKSKMQVDVSTFGAPSMTGKSSQKEIGKIVRSGSLSPRYGELLFRLIVLLGHKNLLELGTGVGTGTLFFAFTSSKSNVWTLEGNPGKARVARNLFEHCQLQNTRSVVGSFRDVLPGVLSQMPSLDFVFFDGDHRREPTLEYFNQCLERVNDNTLFVFDDIHWSAEMESAWNEIIENPLVTVSVDLFRLGLVFFRKDCLKQHYVVLF